MNLFKINFFFGIIIPNNIISTFNNISQLTGGTKNKYKKINSDVINGSNITTLSH